MIPRVLTCLFFGAFCLYYHINSINEVTAMSLEIPVLEREAGTLAMENEQLSYEIDRFESPSHLLELSSKPEYSHLKHPLSKDIILIPRKKSD